MQHALKRELLVGDIAYQPVPGGDSTDEASGCQNLLLQTQWQAGFNSSWQCSAALEKHQHPGPSEVGVISCED